LKPELQYKVIKVARIFTECLALQLLYPDHNGELNRIRQTTKERLLKGFKDSKNLLSLKDVAARYELKCACAVAGDLQTDENKIEKYFEYSSVLINAIQSQSVGDVVKSITSFANALYADISSNPKLNSSSRQKYGTVRVICWTSHAISHKQPQFSLEDIYLHSKTYRSSAKIAFYTLEVLAELFHQSLQNPTELPTTEVFLEGNTDKPGLVTFVQLSVSPAQSSKRKLSIARKTDKRIAGVVEYYKKFTGSAKSAGLSGKVDSFWTVRHRAIEHLHTYSHKLDENHQHRSMIFKHFAKQLCDEKVKPVKNLLKHIYNAYYEDNDTWNDILDEHEKKILEAKNKHAKLVESRELRLRKWKGKSSYESNIDDSLEDNIELSEEQQIDILELELEKEMLEVEQDKLESLY